MKKLSILALLLLLASGVQGVTPGNTSATLWCPTVFNHNTAYSQVMTLATAYQLTIYQQNKIESQMGSALYDQVKQNIFDAKAGILAISKEHGYRQEATELLLCGYQTAAHRNTDRIYLNNLYPASFVNITPADGSFFGLGMVSSRVSSDFSNNTTLVMMDDCYSWNIINGPLSNSQAGAGYAGGVTNHQAAADAVAIWTDMGPNHKTFANSNGGTLSKRGNIHLHRNPDAEFLGARIEDGVLRFWALPRNTKKFIINQGPTPTGPWELVAEIEPVDGQEEYATNTGSDEWMQILEEEDDGTILQQALVRNTESLPEIRRQPLPSFEDVVDALHHLQLSRDNGQRFMSYYDPYRGGGKILLILTVQELQSQAQSWVGSYWQNWWGYETHTLSVPANRHTIKSTIDNWYATAQSQGKQLLVHLIGDGNDCEWWGDPARWPGPWAQIRNNRIASGVPAGGQPERNKIPFWFIEDLRDPGENIGSQAPYIYTDVPYMDVTGDGIPDIVVTRWPVNTNYELASWALKMQQYNDAGVVANPHFINAQIWSGELPLENEGCREQVLATIQNVQSTLPNSEVFWMSDYPNASDRMLAGVNRINQGVDFLYMTSVVSNRFYPGNQLQNYGIYPAFEPEMLWNYQQPIIMGNSCSTVNFGQTNRPNRPDPVCLQLLQSPGRGTHVMIGFTNGSSQTFHIETGGEFVKDFFDQELGWPGPSMAERDLLTRQRLGAQYQGQYGAEMTLLSRMFLGDPCSPFLKRDTMVGVSCVPVTGFAQNYPNPFNPVTTIAFTLAGNSTVELSVFDVRGRQVRVLVKGEFAAGPHRVVWRGDDDSGRELASGVYFSKLTVNGTTRTQKMTLVR